MNNPTQLLLFLAIVAITRFVHRKFSGFARFLLCFGFWCWFSMMSPKGRITDGEHLLSFCIIAGLLTIFQIEDVLVVWSRRRAQKKLGVANAEAVQNFLHPLT